MQCYACTFRLTRVRSRALHASINSLLTEHSHIDLTLTRVSQCCKRLHAHCSRSSYSVDSHCILTILHLEQTFTLERFTLSQFMRNCSFHIRDHITRDIIVIVFSKLIADSYWCSTLRTMIFDVLHSRCASSAEVSTCLETFILTLVSFLTTLSFRFHCHESIRNWFESHEKIRRYYW